MTTPATSAAPPEPVAEPFRYGYRCVTRPGPNGGVECDQIPLTLEDVLHPQENDVIPENTVHSQECEYITSVCRSRLGDRTDVLVLHDCLVNWGGSGVRAMSPDVSIILNVADPGRRRGTFYTVEEGTQPSLVIENVSPDSRRNDVTKIDLYHRVGAPDYVMIDQQREDGPRTLIHFTWAPAGYVQVVHDDDCVLLDVVGLRMCLRNNRVVLFDARTGEEMLDYTELERARIEADRARVEADRARVEAERQTQREIASRLQAEKRVRQETLAREDADRRVLDAEKRLREMEAELRRLRGDPPT